MSSATKQERLQALQIQKARLQREYELLNERSTNYRGLEVTIFVFGLLLFIVVTLISRWLVLPFAMLVVAVFVVAHRNRRQADKDSVLHRIHLQVNEAQIARMRLDWEGIPSLPHSDYERDHPFEIDLDISGERSLTQLLNTTVSYEGYQLLRDWLLNRKPDVEDIRRRQAFIQETVSLPHFCDELQVNSLLATRYGAEQIEGERLVEWLDEHAVDHLSQLTLVVAVLLSAISLTLLVLAVFTLVPPWYCLIALLLSLGWFLARRKELGNLFEETAYLGNTLYKLNYVFKFLETYPYGEHERLKTLCRPFFADRANRPSILLDRLSLLALRASLTQSNAVSLAINTFIPWDFFLAHRLNRYKEQLAEVLPGWLDAWYELEALCSLVNFAYLNPEYTLPEILPCEEQNGFSTFEARGLGHPLIPADVKVVNDFALERPNEIVMITGSNMAGKSTFLRTLGINLCLAYAGAPVNATRLRTSLFEIYACIKVSDSVIDGYSYFYAEVRRLKGLLNGLEARPPLPVFFLIDEIYKGTNNYERLIGSRAYVKSLAEKGCVGAISTHDLELVKLAETLPEIRNFHFREDVIDGKMTFDYVLREGPSPTRNALKIMQMEGLPIE